jgi:hypothetical protein
VGVVASGYAAEENFDVVQSVFKHVSLAAGNFIRDAERAADNGAECLKNLFEAGCCVVAKFRWDRWVRKVYSVWSISRPTRWVKG